MSNTKTAIANEVVKKAENASNEVLSEVSKARINKKGRRVVQALDALDEMLYEGIVDNANDVEAAKTAVYNRLVQYAETFR